MHGWNVPVAQEDKAKRIVAKFKNLRRVLRVWQANLSNLATVISNNKVVLMFMDTMEGFRDLTLEEWNFRNLVWENIEKLLSQQMTYRKQRGRIKGVVLGDKNTKFFHAHATIKYKRKAITSLKNASVKIALHMKLRQLWFGSHIRSD
jgi:hypothetical protein